MALSPPIAILSVPTVAQYVVSENQNNLNQRGSGSPSESNASMTMRFNQ